MSELVTPVILCGGAGTRLWPLSRRGRPKQMLALAGPDSLLRQTAARVGDRTLFAPPVVVAAAAQEQAVLDELGRENVGRLILEPSPRNTAPAIALAALAAGADDLLLVLPSDHLIRDRAAFEAAVRRGVPLARQGWLVTFGMAPDRPETGYGYIKRGAALSDGAYAVERFVEKPDLATAQAFLAQGGFDWNGGIFLFRAGRYLDALRRFQPDILAAAEQAVAGAASDIVRPDGSAFARSPAISIDYAVMEKDDRVAVVPAELGWSDIGSFAALHELGVDEAGNALTGDVLAIDAQGCLMRSDGPLIAAVGVQDLVIVATPGVVLVVPRAQSQRVKEMVDRLAGKGREGVL